MVGERDQSERVGAPVIRLRDEKVLWRAVENEVIALDVAHSGYVGVNRTGAALWPALARGAARAELTSILLERYGVDEATAARDVDLFVAELLRRGLAEERRPA